MTYAQRMAAYAAEAERLAREDRTPKLARAVELLGEADFILIGGAAGLSAAGGMDYQSPQVLRESFPALAALGYHTLWEALWDPKRSLLQKQGMTAAEALWARYDFPVIGAYRDLLALVEGKNYFVLSSNIDDQFYKAGFDPQRVFCPQNSIADFQCSVPCCRALWDGEEIYRNLVAHMDPVTYACREEDLPRCPRCGAPAVRNMRGRACFIPDKVMATRGAFEDFWARAQGGRTGFLELGVGFNSPGLIRHPFQRMTQFWPRAHLIRVNRDYPSVPDKLGERGLALGGDLGENLRRMAEMAGVAPPLPAAAQASPPGSAGEPPRAALPDTPPASDRTPGAAEGAF